MTYRLIGAKKYKHEPNLLIMDRENGFMCKYEMRWRDVRQPD